MNTSFGGRIVLVFVAVALLANCAGAARPIVLVFEPKAGEGADHMLIGSAAKALRNYLRETQKVEATLFNRESPAVNRAVIEKRLTPDQVANYANDQDKTKVAEVLSYDYACGSELSEKDGSVTLKIWVARVGGGKDSRWEATGAAATTGTTDRDTDNAMQSAASAAVNNIARRAFADLEMVAQSEPVKGNETNALSTDQPQQTKPSADQYVSEGDKSLRTGNIALAIQLYTRAVDADPTKPALRIKLADAYMARGMYEEAESELTRAEKAGAEATSLAGARDRLTKLRNGAEIKLPEQTEPTAQDTPPPGSIVMSNADPSIQKILEGDKLWNDGKLDEAADAYKESAKLNPAEWRAWERLAIVDASMALFAESRKALDELKKAQPTPGEETVQNRYEMLRKAFDTHFNALLSHYDTRALDFANGKITREIYYSDANGLALRLESMAKFLDALDVPAIKKPANTRRSLACGLMAQASSSLTDYLETDSKTAKENASVFAAAARKELQEAIKLDGNTAVISK